MSRTVLVVALLTAFVHAEDAGHRSRHLFDPATEPKAFTVAEVRASKAYREAPRIMLKKASFLDPPITPHGVTTDKTHPRRSGSRHAAAVALKSFEGLGVLDRSRVRLRYGDPAIWWAYADAHRYVAKDYASFDGLPKWTVSVHQGLEVFEAEVDPATGRLLRAGAGRMPW